MNTWFRVYNALVDDPKVRKLPDNLVASLLWLWCIAGENDGVLPPIDDVAFKLRCVPAKAAEIVTKLVKAGLFDNDEGIFRPHNWDARQYKTDATDPRGAIRSKKYRDKNRDASRVTKSDASRVTTVRDERPEQSRADTEQSRAERAAVSHETKGEQSDIAVRVLKTDLMEAFGASRCPDLTRASEWIGKGYAPSMCVDVVRELLIRKPDIGNLAYFDKALADRHASRGATPSERAASVTTATLDWAVGHFAKGGTWSRQAGPEPGQPGCRATPALLAKHGIGTDGHKLLVSA
jgi:hypothetical protein